MWSLPPLIKGTTPKVVFSAALLLVLWCSYRFIVCLIQCKLKFTLSGLEACTGTYALNPSLLTNFFKQLWNPEKKYGLVLCFYSLTSNFFRNHHVIFLSVNFALFGMQISGTMKLNQPEAKVQWCRYWTQAWGSKKDLLSRTPSVEKHKMMILG